MQQTLKLDIKIGEYIKEFKIKKETKLKDLKREKIVLSLKYLHIMKLMATKLWLPFI